MDNERSGGGHDSDRRRDEAYLEQASFADDAGGRSEWSLHFLSLQNPALLSCLTNLGHGLARQGAGRAQSLKSFPP